MRRHRREHIPSRPTWRCQVCGVGWPCGTAKVNLLAEYGTRRVDLLVHLATRWAEAVAELAERDGDLRPSHTPQLLLDRFVGWVPTPAPADHAPGTSLPTARSLPGR